MASVGALSISGHQFVHRFEAIECSFLIILSDAFSDKPNKSYSLQKDKMTICRAKYAAQGKAERPGARTIELYGFLFNEKFTDLFSM